MLSPRKSWLAVLCLSTAIFFFAQMMLCFAEDAGIVSCVQAVSQNDDGSNPATSGQVPMTHGCYCASHVSLFAAASASPFDCTALTGTFFDRDDFAPEGPIRKIDHPPQLS